MNRRTFLSAVAVAPVLAALASCGDPNVASGTDPAPDTTPGTTTPGTVPAIEHPTGPADVVLKLAYEGGFVPAGYLFVNTPALLVSGDNRIFTPAVVPAIFPGPLVQPMFVRRISEEGMQSLLGIVQAAGLIAPPPDYPDRHNVADAANTVLTVNAGGQTVVHSAYALGMGDAEAGPRKTLLDVATAIGDLDKVVGEATLEPDAEFVPTTYRFQARAVDPSELTGQNPAPTVVDWPESAGVSPADATDCARVDAAAVGSLFIDATQITYFKQGDVVYQLSVAGVLPGDPAC
jgi:hypothetical protein